MKKQEPLLTKTTLFMLNDPVGQNPKLLGHWEGDGGQYISALPLLWSLVFLPGTGLGSQEEATDSVLIYR